MTWINFDITLGGQHVKQTVKRGIWGTTPAFALRPMKTMENLNGVDGAQDLPDTN
jgi:hypothetical protein